MVFSTTFPVGILMGKALALPILSFDKITKFKVCEGRPLSKNKFVTIDIQLSTLWSKLPNFVHKIMLPFTLYFYMYKANYIIIYNRLPFLGKSSKVGSKWENIFLAIGLWSSQISSGNVSFRGFEPQPRRYFFQKSNIKWAFSYILIHFQ